MYWHAHSLLKNAEMLMFLVYVYVCVCQGGFHPYGQPVPRNRRALSATDGSVHLTLSGRGNACCEHSKTSDRQEVVITR